MSNIAITEKKSKQVRQIIYTLFLSNTFISNSSLKLAKNQAKAKQHPKAELSLFKNYLLFIHVINQQVRLLYWRYMINDTENDAVNKKIDYKDMT